MLLVNFEAKNQADGKDCFYYIDIFNNVPKRISPCFEFKDDAIAWKISLNKLSANWLLGEIASYLNKENLSVSESKVTPEELKELLLYLHNDIISTSSAKQAFKILWDTDRTVKDVIDNG
jgi:Asp-tRNA(Asn)/Glu-tRNA(Gln) amidotransferase B subunit